MAAASPSVSATRSISVADFSCRLPVSGFSFALGGFVSAPTGSYNSEAPDRLPAIQLQRDLGLSYDQQLQRCLPVRRQQVSPDGRTYAYVNFTYQEHGTVTSDGVHVVDAATGRDRLRIPNRPTPSLPWFAGFEAAGIYLSWRTPWAVGHQQSLPTGLALADPLTGQIRPITYWGSWIYLISGAGWGMDTPLAQPAYAGSARSSSASTSAAGQSRPG